MNNHTCLFIDHYHIIIFIDDTDRYILRYQLNLTRLVWKKHLNDIIRLDTVAGFDGLSFTRYYLPVLQSVPVSSIHLEAGIMYLSMRSIACPGSTPHEVLKSSCSWLSAIPLQSSEIS